MRGINYQSLLKNWDTIILKICEEVTTHDVLEIIAKNIELSINDFKKNRIDSSKLEKAFEHISSALKLLDPEG